MIKCATWRIETLPLWRSVLSLIELFGILHNLSANIFFANGYSIDSTDGSLYDRGNDVIVWTFLSCNTHCNQALVLI